MGLFGFGKKKSKKEAEPAVEPVDEDKVAAAEANAAAKAESAETVLAEPASEYQAAEKSEARGTSMMRTCPIMTIIWIWAPTTCPSSGASNCVSRQPRHPASAWFHHHLRLLQPGDRSLCRTQTLGLWDDVRGDLLEANKAASEVDGVFGTELKLPVNVKGGKTVNTRIVGVDGPRWMLRGIFSGKAAIDPDSPETEALNKFFAGIVVERGEEPLAPRDLIPMHPPVAPAERKAAKAAAEAGEANGKEHFKDIPDNKPKGPLSQDQTTEVKTTLARGPMFSEVR